jgi:hypothetical protein
MGKRRELWIDRWSRREKMDTCAQNISLFLVCVRIQEGCSACKIKIAGLYVYVGIFRSPKIPEFVHQKSSALNRVCRGAEAN